MRAIAGLTYVYLPSCRAKSPTREPSARVRNRDSLSCNASSACLRSVLSLVERNASFSPLALRMSQPECVRIFSQPWSSRRSRISQSRSTSPCSTRLIGQSATANGRSSSRVEVQTCWQARRAGAEFLLARVAEHVQSRRVPIRNRPLVVADNNAFGEVSDYSGQPLFALARSCIGLLLGSDIPVGADHVKWLARGIPSNHCDRPDMVDAAIRPNHPEFGIVIPFSSHGRIGRFFGPLAIFRVKCVLPCCGLAAELVPRAAVKTKHLVIPHDRIGQKIVVPNAHSTGPDRQSQAFRSLLQAGLGTLPSIIVFYQNDEVERKALGVCLH